MSRIEAANPLAPRPPLARDPERRVRHVGAGQPLAARMRPGTLGEYVGQQHVIGEGKALRTLVERGELPSMILWGPPGSGKTSLAHVIAAHVEAAWIELSAVTAGVKDVRAVIEQARERHRAVQRSTVLFLDEIHRFNTAQQDALLPSVEDGTILLVGATTENPFFELNAPLMSRCKLVQLNKLGPDDIRTIVHRALADPHRGVGARVELTLAAERELVALGDGDARAALNALEVAVSACTPDAGGTITLDADDVRSAVRNFRYDRSGDDHYDQVSAFIKSMRGSDPDAAVYWLLRMIESGEDPRFLTRRMVIFASEDVGLADRHALTITTSAAAAVDRVGLPEAKHALVHAAIALAVAPKSNSVATALAAGTRAVDEAGNADVPTHLRDAHYAGAERLGHGEGYLYPHEDPTGYVVQDYLPEELHGRVVYTPSQHGDESTIAARLAAWRDRAEAAGSRRRAARATRQGGFIEGLDRAAWVGREQPGTMPGEATGPYDDGRGM